MVSPVSIEPVLIQFKDKSMLEFKEAIDLIKAGKNQSEPVTTVYNVTLKNLGSIHAESKVRFLLSEKEFTKEELEKKTFEVIHLMPGEETIFRADLSYEKLFKGNSYYVGTTIEYYIDAKKKSKVGRIWRVKYLTRTKIDSWIDENTG
ncbi:MAG: hypothetical protein IIA83_07660 [Thaumarchaeota archaeon]|nr:hypothetical protein [Nitrososphaerota archaeon]